jgi:S1-C subfamily serine protease
VSHETPNVPGPHRVSRDEDLDRGPAPCSPNATFAPSRPSTRLVARRASGYTVFVKSGRAYGAGIVFDKRGHVLTANHVVMGDDAEIHFEGSPDTLRARLLERDTTLDLALLQLRDPPPRGFVPAMEGGIDRVTAIERGDEVFAMGSPRKLEFSFQRGVVSFAGRPFDQLYYLQTDLALNPGSSGGPVLNACGALVGIASFILRGAEGLSFALPIDYALRRFTQLDPERDATRRQTHLAAFDAWLDARSSAARHAVQALPAGAALP